MRAKLSLILDTPTEIEPKPFKAPVFLLGIMRSGTTLLMNTLSEHPQLLKVGFELNKVWSEIGGAPCSVECELRTASDLKQEYANNMTAYFQTYIEESKSLKRHLARWSAKRHYGSGGIFYDWEQVHPMNKSPHLSNKVDYVHAMFPNSKFVTILRSLEGQVASMKMHFLKHHQQGNWTFYLPKDEGSCWTNFQGEIPNDIPRNRLFPGNVELLAEAWLRLNKLMLTQLQQVPKAQRLVLTYEKLVENQSVSLSRIFDFLELDPKHQNKVNQICQKQRKVQNTTTSGNPLEKWKKYLNKEEQESLNDFCLRNKEQIAEVDKLLAQL